MNRNHVSLWLFGVISLLATSPVTAVTIATVPVGSPGNAPDPATGSNYGAVAYNYNIGTYDLTNAQYVEFLNAKASLADPYGLWNSAMDPNNTIGFTESAVYRIGNGPYSYFVKPGYANKPANWVSWYDAVRFVNWLTNGQGSGDTESGTYTITRGAPNAGIVVVPSVAQRTSWAIANSFHWLLPSEDEWYKAAYYNAQTATYYAYPFQSNLQPAAVPPPGSTNSGAFGFAAYNYDGNGSYLTDVGAYPNSLSPFGSFDMGGDVSQWTDSGTDLSRVAHGVGFSGSPSLSSASFRIAGIPGLTNGTGFRVASVGGVPEPSTGLLAVLACGVMWWNRKVFR